LIAPPTRFPNGAWVITDKYAEPNDPQVLKRLPDEALTIHKRSDENTSLLIFVQD
jgi:hypothetical protein